MSWRNKLSLCFIPLFIIFFFVIKDDETSMPTHVKKMDRKIASTPKSPLKRKLIQDAQSIRTFHGKGITHSQLRNRMPQSVEATFAKDSSINVSRGYEYLKDVAAVPKDKFLPSMGEAISQDGHTVFFRASPGHSFTPVAIARNSNTLYPISSVLHIKSATAAIRTELLGKGYKEYYYHPALKFLSVETKSGEVMKVYNDLIGQGYQVELEVLKPGHQSN
jgi:hypothetical protein